MLGSTDLHSVEGWPPALIAAVMQQHTCCLAPHILLGCLGQLQIRSARHNSTVLWRGSIEALTPLYMHKLMLRSS